jgi:hypothetical protein
VPKAFIVDYQIEYRGRRRIQAVLQWGGVESLNPRDVGLQTIDSITLSAQSTTPTQQAFPIGSVAATLSGPGSGAFPSKVRGQGPGSTITLRWAFGSTGTRLAVTKAFGTASSGTKTAHAWILGT